MLLSYFLLNAIYVTFVLLFKSGLGLLVFVGVFYIKSYILVNLKALSHQKVKSISLLKENKWMSLRQNAREDSRTLSNKKIKHKC